jgi:hypothetical protein
MYNTRGNDNRGARASAHNITAVAINSARVAPPRIPLCADTIHAGEQPSIDPLVLIGDRSGENVCCENKHAAYGKREKTIQAPGLNGPAALCARTVE